MVHSAGCADVCCICYQGIRTGNYHKVYSANINVFCGIVAPASHSEQKSARRQLSSSQSPQSAPRLPLSAARSVEPTDTQVCVHVVMYGNLHCTCKRMVNLQGLNLQ